MLATWVGAIANGAVYGLIALGVVIIFRATGVVNFAHGELLMLAGYGLLKAGNAGLNSIGELVVVLAIGAALGLLMFLILNYGFRDATMVTTLIGTLGLSIIAVNVARLAFTDIPFRVPGWLTGDSVVHLPGSTVITWNAVLIIVVGIVGTAAASAWLRLTDSGRAVRAVAEDREAAALSGIKVRRILALAWIIGGIFAAIGGLLLTPAVGAYPTMGQGVIFKGFVAATLGGFESIVGAMVGGVIVGLIETAGVELIGGDAKDAVLFVLLLLILLLRPNGLFATAKQRRA